MLIAFVAISNVDLPHTLPPANDHHCSAKARISQEKLILRRNINVNPCHGCQAPPVLNVETCYYVAAFEKDCTTSSSQLPQVQEK